MAKPKLNLIPLHMLILVKIGWQVYKLFFIEHIAPFFFFTFSELPNALFVLMNIIRNDYHTE